MSWSNMVGKLPFQRGHMLVRHACNAMFSLTMIGHTYIFLRIVPMGKKIQQSDLLGELVVADHEDDFA